MFPIHERRILLRLSPPTIMTWASLRDPQQATPFVPQRSTGRLVLLATKSSRSSNINGESWARWSHKHIGPGVSRSLPPANRNAWLNSSETIQISR